MVFRLYFSFTLKVFFSKVKPWTKVDFDGDLRKDPHEDPKGS